MMLFFYFSFLISIFVVSENLEQFIDLSNQIKNNSNVFEITFLLQFPLVKKIRVIGILEGMKVKLLSRKRSENWEYYFEERCEDNFLKKKKNGFIQCLNSSIKEMEITIESASFFWNNCSWWEDFEKIKIEFEPLKSQNTNLTIIGRNLTGCNCFPLGVQDPFFPCSPLNQCLCKNNIASFDCRPEPDPFLHLYPTKGPTKTLLTFHNSSTLELFENYTIYIGSHLCIYHKNREKLNFVYPLIYENGSLLKNYQKVCEVTNSEIRNYFIRVCWDNQIFCLPLDASFTLTPQPSITSFEPNVTIYSGGTKVLLRGKNLDSSPNQLLYVECNFNEQDYLFNSSNLKDATKRVCNSNIKGTEMTCHTPAFNSEKFIDKRCKLKLRPESLLNSFFLIICSNPQIETLNPFIFSYSPRIFIKGSELTRCSRQDDYKVRVGNESVEPEVINNLISFSPPTKNPKQDGGLVFITVEVGTLLRIVGKLDYSKNSTKLPIILGVLSLFSLGVFVVIVLKIKKKACFDQKKTKKVVKDVREIKLLESLEEPLRSQVESLTLERGLITLDQPLGEGFFGKVYKGKYKEEEVAIKTLREGPNEKLSEKISFLQEAVCMSYFKHPNILSLVGVSLENSDPMIALPFMHNGDLKSFLSNPTRDFEVGQLLKMSLQVAKGMEYLASNKFVHRDLAARNCMVDKNKQVKVADFGLTRKFQGDYYYKVTKKNPMPYKWMALELFDGLEKFSQATDVWSFGVLMWEVFTRGKTPYYGVNHQELMDFLGKGKRLECPLVVHPCIYNIMLLCWLPSPDQRPTFNHLIQKIDDLLADKYVQYMKQSEEDEENVQSEGEICSKEEEKEARYITSIFPEDEYDNYVTSISNN